MNAAQKAVAGYKLANAGRRFKNAPGINPAFAEERKELNDIN